MTKLQVKITEYPEQVSEVGRYTIRNVKPPQETRYDLALILIVSSAKNEERSLFVPYSPEMSSRTNLGRLLHAFGDDTDRWVGHKVDVSIDKEGRRTIEPVV
jgi:hypothetical protein